jgi:hypothetical protein
MNHSFDINHATEYGMEGAVLISNLQFWISKNHANGKHFHAGRTWTYNSAKAFAELFPYLSDRQIRRALDRLVEQGVLIKGNFNETTYDRTLWYAFADESKFLSWSVHSPNLVNGKTKSGESLTDIKQIENTDNPPLPPSGGCESKEQKLKRKQPVSLKTFADKCKEAGEPVMSGYEPLIRYAEGVGLPMEFVQLAWDVFKAEHSPGGANERRLQADWRRHFLNYVTKGYYRLWYADALGNFTLTTQGIQAKRLHGQKEAE